MIAVKLIVGLVGLAVAWHMRGWQAQRRREWQDYDDAHGDDPPPRYSRAAARARRARRL